MRNSQRLRHRSRFVTQDCPVVAVDRFIEATRDSGYKTTASAVAELIDNAFEANATIVEVSICETSSIDSRELTVVVADNGCGMSPSVLRLALQFGGSTRFNCRDGVGRYGMGLPNSSLSQARRVDVYTWTTPTSMHWSYLDVDQIAAGELSAVPEPRRPLAAERPAVDTPSGTIVRWSRCDRLNNKKAKTLATKLTIELARTFRRQILNGKSILINGKVIQGYDPLFINKGQNLIGASSYGPPLMYEVKVPSRSLKLETAAINVVFSLLPIAKWHAFSNEEKRTYGISKGAGVSIVRSGREIDHGWFFMGAKRKENYDDWWRCEVSFEATLDEMFGVTHTKQGIHPTEDLIAILTPDLERVAHELNAKVRNEFMELKSCEHPSSAQMLAQSRDYLLEPPIRTIKTPSSYGIVRNGRSTMHPQSLPGLAYRVEHKVLKELSFFIPLLSDGEVVLVLNEDHPFYERIYAPITKVTCPDVNSTRDSIEILLFAAARAEFAARTKAERGYAGSLRESWSNVLAAFLG
jgi:hypothetical protein